MDTNSRRGGAGMNRQGFATLPADRSAANGAAANRRRAIKLPSSRARKIRAGGARPVAGLAHKQATGAGLALLLAAGAAFGPAAHAQTAPFIGEQIEKISPVSLFNDSQNGHRKAPFVSNWNQVRFSPRGSLTNGHKGTAPDFNAVPQQSLQDIASAYRLSWIGEIPDRVQRDELAKAQEQAAAYTGTDWLTSLIVREPVYNAEIQKTIQTLFQAIGTDDLGLYQSVLRHILENYSLAQILAVLRAKTKKEGTILHLMARSRSAGYELQALVSAFLPVTEEPQTSLLAEMRKTADGQDMFNFQRTDLWDQALKEALQKNGGALSLNKTPAADAILRQDAAAFHEALKQEMTQPGNSSLARALLLGRTEEGLSPLDHRWIQNFPPETKAAFSKEIALVSRWLTLPLQEKNAKGQTALEIADSWVFRKGGAPNGFIALARAEQAFGTDIDSPAYQNRPVFYGKSALAGAGAIGAAAGAALAGAACFLAFAD